MKKNISKNIEIRKSDFIFEDKHMLLFNKKAGILSQKAKDQSVDAASLIKRFRHWDQQFLAPVHRLDRNTSGLLLFARSSETANFLSEQLRVHAIKRTYLALVKGDPGESGTIDAPLSKDNKSNQSKVDPDGKPAITHFKKLKIVGGCSLIELNLETGRSHQIRAHLSSIGHPIIGDKKYAKKPWSELFSRQALHAYKMEIPNPNKSAKQKLLKFEIELSEDIQKLITQISDD